MKKNIRGVFLLLETDDNQIMIVEENNENNRPWKRHGQISTPAGTIEPGDSPEITIRKEFKQETGLSSRKTIIKQSLEKIGEILLETDEYSLQGFVYKGKIPIDTKEKIQGFSSEEIGSVQIISPDYIFDQVIEKIRPGLLEVLLLKYSIPSDIVYIENGAYRNIDQAKEKISQLKQLYNNAETECYS